MYMQRLVRSSVVKNRVEHQMKRSYFDSIGTALQDVAAAAIVYENAVGKNIGAKLDFAI
jgi:ornithine cyclodeaminase/alanine dehydrogenase-like protein (mu-crystallin family)